ncbi:ImuA family protein [Aureimonas populi]|uniref:ImuA family protein n=1 Tax=Aureimonas populi TaxID=1701758 RepID=A0ABW5CM23_9HYPH|nr:hypothetical protein [Aureimonas populi]
MDSASGAARVAALRQAIARIEGTVGPRLRRGPVEGEAERNKVLSLGVPGLDKSLSGGLPACGLSELRVGEARDSGAGTGLALGLAALFGAAPGRPLLWIGQDLAFHEAGLACREGLAGFGLDPGALVVVRARRVEDAVWAGEEAARSGAPALTILEVRGNPKLLSLEGTRRLHLRARESGRPFLLLRQSAAGETSSAPVRLLVSPAASLGERAGRGRLIGAPVFRVRVEKAPGGRGGQFLLEWNLDEHRFEPARRAAPLSRPVAAAPAERPHPARQAGPRLALGRAS